MTARSDVALFLQQTFSFLPSLEPLRSHLVPEIISELCFSELFIHFELFNFSCMKDLVSKLAGYAIVLLSSILKLPILYNILSTKTTEGLSISSLTLECLMYVSHIGYNYFTGSPFSTYGENVMILVQNIMILGFIFYFEKRSVVSVISSVVFFVLFCVIVFLTPEELFWMLISFTILCAMISKIPQIYTNFFMGHTGVLSLATSTLQVGGASVRLLTVINDNPDTWILITNIVASLLNAMIFLQIVLFRKKTRQMMQAKTTEKAIKVD